VPITVPFHHAPWLARLRRLLLAAFAALLLAGTASSDAMAGPDERRSATVAAAQRALGVAADGIAGPRTRRAIRRFQREHGLTVDGILGPQTLAALGVGEEAAAGSVLGAIAECESGGDPEAVSADGRYRGKYQFSRATWRAVGGTGDPAAAPEAEQDQRAALLLERHGTTPWPNCA